MSAKVERTLPRGWVTTTIGDITQPFRPRHRPGEYPNLPFIGMEHIEAHTMRLLDTVPAHTMKSSAVHCWPGDVLYGRLRPYLNKVYRPEFEGLCSAEFMVFPASEHLDSGYLQYLLNSSDFVSFASRLNTGDRPRVDFEQIASYPVPLPPLPEQRRIAAEIEKHLTRLDASAAALKRAQANLKRYRAAVLQAACEGRLVPTEADLARTEGREYEPANVLLERILREHRAQLEVPTTPDTSGLPELPEGWAWASWKQIGSSQNGRAFPSREYRKNGIKLLRPGNLSRNGRVEWNEENTRYMPHKWAEDFPSYVVGPRELVMNLTAQSLKDEFLGRICITGPSERCLLNQRIARLTTVAALPEYLLCVFRSRVFRRFVDGLNTGSLIQHMFTSQLARFDLPLAPLAEQQRIVAEVDRRLSLVDQLEAVVEHSLNRASRLRQAVLKRAFEGKLVPQDPNDEPASVLLDRIRAERAARAQSENTRRPRRAPRRQKTRKTAGSPSARRTGAAA